MENTVNNNNQESIGVKPKKTKPKFERVILDDQSKVICKDTLVQLAEKYPGLKVSKSDLVNWVIKNSFKSLKPAAEKKIFKEFYDEEMFLAMTLKEIRQKKKNGESVNIKSVFEKLNSLSKPKKKAADQSELTEEVV